MFRLARELGYTVAEIGERMTSRELSEWMALATLEAKEAEEQQQQASMAQSAQSGTQTIRRALGHG